MITIQMVRNFLPCCSFLSQCTTEYAPSSHEPFSTFMSRASRCRDVFSSNARPHIILLEDLPNILHSGTQQSFHESLRSLVQPSDVVLPPIVIIISDAGLRGTELDEVGAMHGRDSVIDVRTVLPKEMLNGPFVTRILYVVAAEVDWLNARLTYVLGSTPSHRPS